MKIGISLAGVLAMTGRKTIMFNNRTDAGIDEIDIMFELLRNDY